MTTRVGASEKLVWRQPWVAELTDDERAFLQGLPVETDLSPGTTEVVVQPGPAPIRSGRE